LVMLSIHPMMIWEKGYPIRGRMHPCFCAWNWSCPRSTPWSPLSSFFYMTLSLPTEWRLRRRLSIEFIRHHCSFSFSRRRSRLSTESLGFAASSPFRLNRGFEAGFRLNHSVSLLPLLFFPFRLNRGFGFATRSPFLLRQNGGFGAGVNGLSTKFIRLLCFRSIVSASFFFPLLAVSLLVIVSRSLSTEWRRLRRTLSTECIRLFYSHSLLSLTLHDAFPSD
jgi:hypothetical protein